MKVFFDVEYSTSGPCDAAVLAAAQKVADQGVRETEITAELLSEVRRDAIGLDLGTEEKIMCQAAARVAARRFEDEVAGGTGADGVAFVARR